MKSFSSPGLDLPGLLVLALHRLCLIHDLEELQAKTLYMGHLCLQLFQVWKGALPLAHGTCQGLQEAATTLIESLDYLT